MRTIDLYMNNAKTRLNLPSDAALARALGVNPTTVNHWRTKRAWPGDEVMLKLSDLAGMNAESALLDLSGWRVTGNARRVYDRIARKVAATAAAFAVAYILCGAPGFYLSTVEASEIAHTVYYGKWPLTILLMVSIFDLFNSLKIAPSRRPAHYFWHYHGS